MYAHISISTCKYIYTHIYAGFLYNSDTYADDLPYWNMSYGKPLLMIPYTLDNNDMRFSQVVVCCSVLQCVAVCRSVSQ